MESSTSSLITKSIKSTVSTLLLSYTFISFAATPGLPFTEDFNNVNLKDTNSSYINWHNGNISTSIAQSKKKYGSLRDVTTTFENIGNTNDNSSTVLIADFNGDGYNDVVVGNNGINKLYINNKTSNPFNAVLPENITLDNADTRALDAADFNGDGLLDLIVGNVETTNRLYLNNGTASPFSGISGLNISNDIDLSRGIVAADFNNDGHIDVASGNWLQPDKVYLNNGTQNPFEGVTGQIINDIAVETSSIDAGDIDNDGDVDIVTSTWNGLAYSYYNNGSNAPFSTSTASQISSESTLAFDIKLGDLNGDGYLDVVVANNGGAPGKYSLNTGGSFNGMAYSDYTLSNNNTDEVAIADVDGDGDLDIVQAIRNAPNMVFYNSGTETPFDTSSGLSSIIHSNDHVTSGLDLADIDNDGDLDLVTATSNATTTKLYKNNNNGSPYSAISSSNITNTSNITYSSATADLNNDGLADVVTANSGQTNRIYINNGTSTPFNGVPSDPISADTDNSRVIRLADFNSDGALDAVVGNANQANRIYLNNKTAQPFNAVLGSNISNDTDNTWTMVTGDFDNDGDIDVVTANLSSTNKLYLNNGSSSPFNLVTAQTISADTDNTYSLAAADFNQDGHLDLIAGNTGINKLYLNNGTSTPFSGVSAINISIDSDSTYGLTAGDFDGDGDIDIIAGNYNGINKLYLNDGSNTAFSAATAINITTEANRTYSVAAFDMDFDGDLDLVEGNYTETNKVYVNNGTSNPFSDTTAIPVTNDVNNTLEISIIDIDNNGSLDLVAANYSAINQLYQGFPTLKYINGFKGDYIDSPNFTTPPALRDTIFGDVDADGKIDLITADSADQTVYLYLNTGATQPYSDATRIAVTNYGYVNGLSLADADNDGDLDLFTAGGTTNRVFYNDGSSTPFTSTNFDNITTDSTGTLAIVTGDFNSDGHIDVIAANNGINRIYLNNTTATPYSGITGSNISADSVQTSDISAVDIDEDGDLDIVLANSGADNQLFLNTGSGTFTEHATFPNDGKNTRAVATGDIDNDGDIDIVFGTWFAGNDFYTNTNLTFAVTAIETYTTPDLALADLDNDGDLDLITANTNTQKNRLYLNDGSATPFTAANGFDITNEYIRSHSVSIADANGDGILDILFGNENVPARIFTRDILNTAHNIANSLEVDTESLPIYRAKLDADYILTTNTNIEFYLSNNSGQKYYQVKPGVTFEFPTTGNDLRWKAKFLSRSPILSPVLNRINITGNNAPAYSGTPSIIGDATLGSILGLTDINVTDLENDTVTLSYQWQESSDNSNFNNIATGTSSTIKVTNAAAHRWVRCLITANDQHSGITPVYTASIQIENTSPFAKNDTYVIYEDTPLIIDASNGSTGLLDNDSDPDLVDTLSVTGVSVTTNGGSLVDNGNGTYTYTPASNFFGLDTFGYQIDDGEGGSDTAAVNIVVNPVNDSPVISGTPATTADPDATYVFTPTASDNDGDALLYLINNKPAWATFDPATGTFAGIPADSDYGTTSGIVISVTDGTATTALAPFDISVGDNKAPTVSADIPTGDFNAAFDVTLTCSDSGSGCANIYYTTDGSTPTTSSTVYSTPVTISGTTDLQFIATDNEGNISGSTLVAYVFDTTAPVIAITTPGAEFMSEVLLISGTASDTDSGLSRVQLQITDGTNSVIEVNGVAALVPFPAEWVDATKIGGTWNYLTSFSWSENKTYTVTARARDNAGNTSQISTSFTYYTSAPSFTEIPQLVLSSQTILQNETLTISGILQFPGNEGFDMSNLPVDITVQDPNAAINTYSTTTYDNAGHFTYTIPDLTDFALKGTYIIKASFVGNIRLQAATSVGSTILVGSSAGYAVIVQGKLENDEGLDSHNKSANRVYSTLIERGFLPENIRYFNYDDTQPGVYATPTKAGLQDAIETWLPSRVNGSPAPMYIVGVDHGNDDLFYLDTERLTSSELDTMLDNLEGALSVDAQSEPRVLIYGACYSGSFIPNVSAPGRVVITSAAADEESYKGAEEPDGVRVGEYFLEEYFKEMRNGYSLKEAFEIATERTEIYTREGTSTNSVNAYFDDAVQHPLLDDNGDATGSNNLSDQVGADGDITKDMYLGAGLSLDTNSAENPATFVDVTDPVYLDASTSTTALWGITNVPAVEVTAAWLEIRVPTKVLVAQGGTNQLTNDLIRVDMTYNSTSGRWEGSYDQFTDPGTYEVYYFVQDSATNKISTALISNVYKQEATNQAPVAFSLLSPANGSQQNVVLAFDWEDSSDPDDDTVKYNLLIADDNSFSNIIHSQTGLSSSSTYVDYAAGLPKSNATLYWKVEAVDTYGSVTTSPVFTFDTDSPNSTPGVIQGLVYAAGTFAQISGATVSSDSGDIVLTEYNGQFIMITSSENVKLTSSSTGYDSSVINDVDVVPGEVIEVNIEMKTPSEDTGGGDTGGGDTGDTGGDSGGGGGGAIHLWWLLILGPIIILRRKK